MLVNCCTVCVCVCVCLRAHSGFVEVFCEVGPFCDYPKINSLLFCVITFQLKLHVILRSQYIYTDHPPPSVGSRVEQENRACMRRGVGGSWGRDT